MSNALLPCLICGKKLENVYDECQNQPSRALCFLTQGHYGATIVDVFDRFYLEINICEPCVREAAKKNLVAIGQTADKDGQLEIWPGQSEEAQP